MVKTLLVTFLYIAIVFLLMRLSWSDIKYRIISNKIVVLLSALLIPLAWLQYQQIFVLPALVALVIGFILFNLGVIGAGDVKLIAVLMLSLPHEQILPFFFFTAFSGLLLIVMGWLFYRKSIREKGLPYGVAISLGFLTNALLFA
ncbi:prepilin peptidase CpaA [Mesocricetibacter intestinalis]|uniref:Prepilin peptidase CpaA n=1 Tax=Mesocricetibacter intestinalis TaxID=1521930 RepID=A0A4R6VBI4_9PAST|nr:prepilin peptidase [Mesocricetibacter intestinalis]TDQ57640.1 prepilin peptidase CpaA [Mesocricetibacter intestinalis]